MGIVLNAAPAAARERAARFSALVDELRNLIRSADPQLDEESLVHEAVFHAAWRLAGGSLLPGFIRGAAP